MIEKELIKISDINSRSEHDRNYLNALAKEIDCPIENLQSIVGLDELKDILKTLNFDNFNPQSENYIANLHTHTIFSDGAATVEDILNEAQLRAEKCGNNFLVGINDHDTLNSAKETVKLVSKNSEKYKNLRIVIAVEPCFKYENKKLLKCPIPFDCLIYCINPFDKVLNEFFDKYTNKNRDYIKLIFQKANNRWNINANYKDACDYHCLIKTGGSSGFFKFNRHYLESLLDKKNIFYSPVEMVELFKRFSLNQNFRVTLATPDIHDARIAVNKSGYGEIGLAHPALVEFNPKADTIFDFKSDTNLGKNLDYDKVLSEFLKDCNFELVELNYQYPQKLITAYPDITHFIEIINSTCLHMNVIPTGGTTLMAEILARY